MSATSLSVQVHPSDRQTDYIPAGETGKTEAWVVLEAGPESRIYAGLKPGSTADGLRRAIANKTVAEHLACFTPKPGDGVLVPAGTVHSLSDVVVFEVQENSDVTFRLYDWDHVDPKTGQPRPLQVDQALACIDFAQGAIGPVVPVVEEVSRCCGSGSSAANILGCRESAENRQFVVGAAETPRVLVCIAGDGQLEHAGTDYAVTQRRRVPLAGRRRSMSAAGRAARSPLLDISLPEGNASEMKKLIVFDLDGTLAESKASIDAEMATLLDALLGIVKVAVISGGNWPQFEKQVLAHLPHDGHLANLSLLPTCGTKFYRYAGDWEKIYSEDFTAAEKEKIIGSLKKSIAAAGCKVEKVWGEVIEDRGSQITFSALGPAGSARRKENMGPRLRQAEEDQSNPR